MTPAISPWIERRRRQQTHERKQRLRLPREVRRIGSLAAGVAIEAREMKLARVLRRQRRVELARLRPRDHVVRAAVNDGDRRSHTGEERPRIREAHRVDGSREATIHERQRITLDATAHQEEGARVVRQRASDGVRDGVACSRQLQLRTTPRATHHLAPGRIERGRVLRHVEVIEDVQEHGGQVQRVARQLSCARRVPARGEAYGLREVGVATEQDERADVVRVLVARGKRDRGERAERDAEDGGAGKVRVARAKNLERLGEIDG
jgi:hypothetical protein